MATKDEQLVAHLAAGRSYDAVAQIAGVSKATVYRKMRQPRFRARVRLARADVLQRALGHLSRASVEAAITLRNLLRSTSERIKLDAARVILGAEIRFRESEELAADIDLLQAQVAALKRSQRREQSQ